MVVENNKLVQVLNLKKYFPISQGSFFQRHSGDIKAVDNVSFDIYRGKHLDWWGRQAAEKPQSDVPYCIFTNQQKDMCFSTALT